MIVALRTKASTIAVGQVSNLSRQEEILPYKATLDSAPAPGGEGIVTPDTDSVYHGKATSL